MALFSKSERVLWTIKPCYRSEADIYTKLTKNWPKKHTKFQSNYLRRQMKRLIAMLFNIQGVSKCLWKNWGSQGLVNNWRNLLWVYPTDKMTWNTVFQFSKSSDIRGYSSSDILFVQIAGLQCIAHNEGDVPKIILVIQHLSTSPFVQQARSSRSEVWAIMIIIPAK